MRSLLQALTVLAMTIFGPNAIATPSLEDFIAAKKVAELSAWTVSGEEDGVFQWRNLWLWKYRSNDPIALLKEIEKKGPPSIYSMTEVIFPRFESEQAAEVAKLTGWKFENTLSATNLQYYGFDYTTASGHKFRVKDNEKLHRVIRFNSPLVKDIETAAIAALKLNARMYVDTIIYGQPNLRFEITEPEINVFVFNEEIHNFAERIRSGALPRLSKGEFVFSAGDCGTHVTRPQAH